MLGSRNTVKNRANDNIRIMISENIQGIDEAGFSKAVIPR